ncbi:hypothetical protein CROQUDRAFT_140768 [Cronartium quercuum f. sp. fusiforme G11]|uniref:Transmembrane protein n=1 Tax=Cronartium quercuum f. sp. fusiforme G11 TaxID=708437 RepID=A0A9P6NS10_9BASI|nr:hypothetical protein CROQUDRAFT_140768 [Cronartium quercuum f. sp. fusiforme G11]
MVRFEYNYFCLKSLITPSMGDDVIFFFVCVCVCGWVGVCIDIVSFRLLVPIF